MGARPIAAMNSLRFGNPEDAHMQHLIKGVVKGIGDYGNCFGVPTVGGEAYFDPCYQQNILVNAFSAGIVKADETISACADGPGNPVFIIGSSTGKDGIHGATLLLLILPKIVLKIFHLYRWVTLSKKSWVSLKLARVDTIGAVVGTRYGSCRNYLLHF